MLSNVTIAQALVAALKNYKHGMNYESLVDVMRDLAAEQYEEFRFPDGSAICIEQSDRLEDGTYTMAKVNISDDEEHCLVTEPRGDEGE